MSKSNAWKGGSNGSAHELQGDGGNDSGQLAMPGTDSDNFF